MAIRIRRPADRAPPPPQTAVDFGAAHGALAMSTPGDNAMTSLAEVMAMAEGRGAAAIR